jgi:CRP-like cAMP-binding protein
MKKKMHPSVSQGGTSMETKKDLYQLLAEHPFFKEMVPDNLKVIAGFGHNQHFNAGTYLFYEGENAANFYLLQKGRIALGTNILGPGMVTVETIEAGEVVGWSWLISPYKWNFSARIVEDVDAIVINATQLRERAEQDHDLGYLLYRKFFPVVLERLQATRLQLLDIYHYEGGD